MGKTDLWVRPAYEREKHPHGRGEDLFLNGWNRTKSETPPRAWGRRGNGRRQWRRKRNTPTGVGKTGGSAKSGDQDQKHPHGRGEDRTPPESTRVMPETPPRAWGRPAQAPSFRPSPGNTPTGVGKTSPNSPRRSMKRKHPHGRGEDRIRISAYLFIQETPPRAWGRLCMRRRTRFSCGNTPTGVGKTLPQPHCFALSEKHPHGRGEDGKMRTGIFLWIETPPRAWGRQLIAHLYMRRVGNTPTGVGKTVRSQCRDTRRRKHPHGRGEDHGIGLSCNETWETPPRAWGRPPPNTRRLSTL